MTLIEELASLDGLTSKELRSRWLELTGRPIPRVSLSLLGLALAWKLQACAFGGHTREIKHLLAQFKRGRSRTSSASAGMRLVREWRGTTHLVVIDEAKRISWNGHYWNSLSEVAREITGTRWSGPAFFGLKKTAA